MRWDYVLVHFADAPDPQLAIDVEDLWHMGVPLADPLASGGQAVELLPGYHPHDAAFSGPDRVLWAGAWVATLRFKAAAAAGSPGGERFEATSFACASTSSFSDRKRDSRTGLPGHWTG